MSLDLLKSEGHFRKWLLEQHPNEKWLEPLLDDIVNVDSNSSTTIVPSDLTDAELNAIEALLRNEKMICTSLNFSWLQKQQIYRITMLRLKSSAWLTGLGPTFGDAVKDLQATIDAET